MTSSRWATSGVLLLLVTALPLLAFFGIVPPAAALVSAVVVVSWILWRLGTHATTLMLIVALAALAGTVVERPGLNLSSGLSQDDGETLLSEWRSRGPFDGTLPVVVHVVLDEMMSPGAIDSSIPDGAPLLEGMRSFGQTHGFRLFDSVYSRFFFSGVSIPNMTDAEYRGLTAIADLSTAVAGEQKTNAYFADMASRGYKTVVFQSAVLDFCRAVEVRMCDTFPSFDPAAADEANLDERTRSIHLWDALLRFFEPSHVSRYGRWFIRARHGLDQRELGNLGVADRFDVHGFPQAFTRFARFVAQVPRGTHVFAHFVVPHSPYGLTRDCIVSGGSDSGYYLGARFPEAERESVRRQFYGAYFRQASCVMMKLDEMMRMLEQSPSFDDAWIVIHGDHGSRISVGNYVEDYTAQDFVDNYGTFFAVRRPGVEPGLDCEFISLPQVFRRAMRQGNRVDAESVLPVIVSTRAAEGARVEAPMPRFGCAATPHLDPLD